MSTDVNGLEEKLLADKSFQHILKFAPQSQRELMTFELAKYFEALIKAEQNKLLDRIEREAEYVTSIVSIDKQRDKYMERLHPDNYHAKWYIPKSAIKTLREGL